MKILTFNESIRDKMIGISKDDYKKGLSKIIKTINVDDKNINYDNLIKWLKDNDYEITGEYTITNMTEDKITKMKTTRVINKYLQEKNKSTSESHILRFDDIQNLEFRKGSLEHGDKVKQLIEFLLIYKNENEDTMVFNKDDFEKASKMKISEIEQLNNLPTKKSLFDFNIEITDDQIKFTNLQKRKSLHTESKVLYLKDF